MNKTEVVYVLRDVRKDITHPFAGLAVLLKSKRRGKQAVLCVSQCLAIHNTWPFPRMFFDFRFVIKGVDLRRTTGHEELNNVLGFRRKVGSFGCQGRPYLSRVGRFGSEQTRQAERTTPSPPAATRGP